MSQANTQTPPWVWTVLGWLIFIAIIIAIGVFNDHSAPDPTANYVSPQCIQAAAC